jgi:biopolymer transport protein ExbD
MTTMRKRKPESPPLVSMAYVTSMLDLAFQLVFFFVINFDPTREREGEMQMSLPPKEEARAQRQEDVRDVPPKTDDIPPLTDEYKVYVDRRTEDDFTIRVENGLVKKDFSRDAKKQGNELESFKNYLTEQYQQKKEKIEEQISDLPPGERQTKFNEEIERIGVRVRGSHNLSWGSMVRVIDVCRQAGFTNISPASPHDKPSPGDD